MYFFTSDTHFGDDEVLKQDLRPFKNAKQFAKVLINTWNKQAKNDDTIFVVGDFVDCDGNGYDSWKQSLLLVKKIKAQVVLIVGNNEERVIKYYFDNDFDKFKAYCLSVGFKDVCKNMTLKMRDTEFFLTHKPLNYNPNYFNLFGHMHASGGLYKPFGLNIGCAWRILDCLVKMTYFILLTKNKNIGIKINI